MKYLFILIAVSLAGCDPNSVPRTVQPNQKLRHQYFEECLKTLPAGPVTTHYNDWNEVVDSCENAAYYQSLQLPGQPEDKETKP